MDFCLRVETIRRLNCLIPAEPLTADRTFGRNPVAVYRGFDNILSVGDFGDERSPGIAYVLAGCLFQRYRLTVRNLNQFECLRQPARWASAGRETFAAVFPID